MKSTVFIPKLCKVGFNHRSDTYTGKLAYVIYNDGKKWRKEDSWMGWIENCITDEEFQRAKVEDYNRTAANHLRYAQTRSGVHNGYTNMYVKGKWCDVRVETLEDAFSAMGPLSSHSFVMHRCTTEKDYAPYEFENVPTEGFVLNKKAGGEKYSWNQRQTYCRVYDPRGFEFELTIPNLLYILENTNSIKGKGLEGRFVYGWDGKELVLVPESAPEYEELLAHSERIQTNVKKSALVVGNFYLDKNNRQVVYMGEGYKKTWRGAYSATKALWFAQSGSDKFDHNNSNFDTKDIKNIITDTGEKCHDYAFLADKLDKSDCFVKDKPVYVIYKDGERVLRDKLQNTSAYSSCTYITFVGNRQTEVQIWTYERYIRGAVLTTEKYYAVKVGKSKERTEFTSIASIIEMHPMYHVQSSK